MLVDQVHNLHDMSVQTFGRGRCRHAMLARGSEE